MAIFCLAMVAKAKLARAASGRNPREYNETRVFSGGPIHQKHGTTRSEVRFQVSCIPPLEFSLPVCSPSHHHPDDFVEFLKADCFRNNEAPPDGLRCSEELDFELKTLFHW